MLITIVSDKYEVMHIGKINMNYTNIPDSDHTVDILLSLSTT